MQSPLALVLDNDPSARARAKDALGSAGIEAVTVATVDEALELLARLRADAAGNEVPTILGRSSATEALRQRVQALAASRAPVLFVGEPGSGRRYAARCLHALSRENGSFVVVPTAGDGAELSAALEGAGGTVFVPSLEHLTWPAQEALARALAETTHRPRVTASTAIDVGRAAEEGRFAPALAAAFRGSFVAVPPLRERRMDIAILVSAFIE